MKYITTIMLLILCACGTMTRNQVVEGELDFFMDDNADGGKKDRLTLKRVSWFRELTMQTELVYLNAKEFSEFQKVTSIESALKRCPTVILIGLYNELNSSPKKSDIMSIFLSDSTVEKIAVEDARKFLASHPQYLENSFNMYDFHGLCIKRTLSTYDLPISGHKNVQMNF